MTGTTPTGSAWHVPPDTLRRFAADSRSLDDATAASLELHLMACGVCRQAVTALATATYLEKSWAAIADRIDRPRDTTLERVLTRVGADPSTSRLVGATPALQLAWLGAIVIIVAMVTGVGAVSDSVGPLLLLAPVAPLAAVAVAFLFSPEPGGESAYAAPLHGAGLWLRRALSVLAVSMLVLGAGGVALPILGAPATAAWLLPSMALAISALALSTWTTVETASAVFAAAWGVVVFAALAAAPPGASAADFAVFTAGGQIVAALAVVVAAAIVFRRRHTLVPIEGVR